MNIFFISDTHFKHEAPYTKFTKSDDCTMLRPHGSAEKGDYAMLDNWNKVVKPTDKVYHIGDVSMGTKRENLDILHRMNGEKILIKGNHDLAKPGMYLDYFKDIRGSHQFDGMILTHIPIHPDSLSRWGLNVHGHLHANEVKGKWGKPDPRYLNVSVEQPWMNYTPISLEEVKALAKNRLELYGEQ